MPTKPVNPQSTKGVPLEYAGKWVAWNSDHTEIVACSDNIQELWQMAKAQCIANPIFEKVPRADVRFMGTQ